MPKPPPYPSLREARTRGGDAGVLALVRWVAAEHPPGRSTLSAAAIALGADAKDSDAVRSLAGALRKAAAHVGAPLPEYPRGTPAGHPSHAERRATAEAAAAKTKPTNQDRDREGRWTVTAPASVPPPVVAERNEDRAWYDLARDLRVVSADAPGPAGIDYERAAHRVQCGPASPEDAMIAQAVRGAGHVRADPVAARLAALPSGRGRLVCVWLRGFAPALEWLAADKVQSKRGALLDALSAAGVATTEDTAAWSVAERAVTARRAWARAALREAWALWYGRAW